jgi:hypothetical protein
VEEEDSLLVEYRDYEGCGRIASGDLDMVFE